MRTLRTIALMFVALHITAEVSDAATGMQPDELIDRRVQSTALEPHRPSLGVRIVQYAFGAGLVVVLVAWAGRRRAEQVEE